MVDEITKSIKAQNIPLALRKTDKLIRLVEQQLNALYQLKASLLNAKNGYPIPERAQARQLELPFENQ